jgi:hypothetical protein
MLQKKSPRERLKVFTIQFGCLEDWNKAMHMGTWLFNSNYALLLEEYDGFRPPELVVLDKLEERWQGGRR